MSDEYTCIKHGHYVYDASEGKRKVVLSPYKCRKHGRYVWCPNESEAITQLGCAFCLMVRGKCGGPVASPNKKEDKNNDD